MLVTCEYCDYLAPLDEKGIATMKWHLRRVHNINVSW